MAFYSGVIAYVQLLNTMHNNLLLHEFSELWVHQLICTTIITFGMYVYHTHIMAMLASAGSSRERHAG